MPILKSTRQKTLHAWDTKSFWQGIVVGLVIILILLPILFDISITLKPRFPLKAATPTATSAKAATTTPAASTPHKDVPEVKSAKFDDLAAVVIPDVGLDLPIRWNDLGKKLVEGGVIDPLRLEALYAQRGGLKPTESKLLYEVVTEPIKMDSLSAGFLLNLFWALGLGNKNDILDKGPMQDPRYGGADRFASTSGWTLAKSKVMDHYSKHPLIILTPTQQELVERVSKGIFRPCCGNSTYFPDCNHGMAMLGLLELMAAQNVTEEEMYKVALQVNAYWFPDTYLTIAKYLASKGKDYRKVDPKELLGADYSSSAGYRRILTEVEPVPTQGGGGCGV